PVPVHKERGGAGPKGALRPDSRAALRIQGAERVRAGGHRGPVRNSGAADHDRVPAGIGLSLAIAGARLHLAPGLRPEWGRGSLGAPISRTMWWLSRPPPPPP